MKTDTSFGKPVVPSLMLTSLSEKQNRQAGREHVRTQDVKRSVSYRAWHAIKGMVSFTAFLFLEGNLGRAVQIVYRLSEAILFWMVDWLIYPVRSLSGWRILSRGLPEGGDVLAKSSKGGGSPFTQHSFSIYEAEKKPSLARRLMIAFQNLGPTFIKLGQIVSMLVVLPHSFTSEFARLCDYLPAESFETVCDLIKKELGSSPQELFDYISPEPIGAASLAQVHCIVLKDGSDAVIKVQRPNLKATFDRDFRILGPVAALMEMVLKVLRPLVKMLREIQPVELLKDYGEATSVDELDFGYEATIMQMYANALEEASLRDQLRVPRVYWEYTTRSVLTMERLWIYFKLVDIDVGRPQEIYDCLDFLKGLGYDSSLVLKRGHRAWWWPFSRYGLLNMDVHHGNFLYGYDNVLELVDFGINYYAGSSPWVERYRPGIVQIWRGIMSSNYDDVMQALKGNLGILKGVDDEKATKIVAEEFENFLNPLIHCTERDGATGGFITDANTYARTGDFWKSIVDILQGIARKAGVSLEYEMLAIIRMVPYWATWMQIIDPTWDLFAEGDSLNAYWFGPDDGKVPYQGTEVYPEPALPYIPELWIKSRGEAQTRDDDLSLCYAPVQVNLPSYTPVIHLDT